MSYKKVIETEKKIASLREELKIHKENCYVTCSCGSKCKVKNLVIFQHQWYRDEGG
jgi:hypothetical protein